jgi:hypothetical protein
MVKIIVEVSKMAQVGIIREPTEDEKKDFIPIGRKTVKEEFRKRLIQEEQKYTKAHKPFCARCARLDFQDKVERTVKEIERLNEPVEDTKIKHLIPKDFNEYGDKDRFEEVDKSDVMENKLIDGVRVPYKVGFFYKYKCKKRKCGLSVFVPIEKEQSKSEK